MQGTVSIDGISAAGGAAEGRAPGRRVGPGRPQVQHRPEERCPGLGSPGRRLSHLIWAPYVDGLVITAGQASDSGRVRADATS